jgi:predicted Zn-dependent peptidase
MSIVSDLEPKNITTVIESTFGRLPKGESFRTEFPSCQLPGQKEIRLKKETSSPLLAVAFPLPPLSARNYVLANFLEAIIGGGPGSKIWPLRSEEGLAYEVGSRLILMKGGGLLIIYLKTLPEKIELARAKFQEKLKEIENRSLNEGDLQMGSNSFRLWLYQHFEAKIKKAEVQAHFRALEIDNDLTENSLETYLHKISLNDLADFFKEVFNLEKSVFLEIIPPGNDLAVERSRPG